MEIQKLRTLTASSKLILLSIMILFGTIFITVSSTLQSQRITSHASEAISQTPVNCQPNNILVNPCRPWLGAAADGYPGVASDSESQFEYLEQLTGRKLDIFHDYHPPGSLPLNSAEIYFAERANTYIYVNWKPASNWASADGGNATVNSQIDQAAASIKSVAPHKIFLTIWHEPENDVSPGTSSCPGLKGAAGSPAQYISMWQNVENRFKADGVTNVVWVMNYMSYQVWDCLVPQLWPGNNLVDWVAMDPYPVPSTPTWAGTVGRFYNVLLKDESPATDFTSKPWAVAEFGTCYFTQESQSYTYFQEAKQALDANTYPNLKMYILFDSNEGPGANNGCLTNYTSSGTLDPTKQLYWNDFANDSIFANAPIPTPTMSPTLSPTTVMTIPPTSFSVTACPHGIGNCGDDANPSYIGNTSPMHPIRSVELTFLNRENIPVATADGNVTYNTSAMNFQGTVTVPNLPGGNYLILLHMHEYLITQLPLIVSTSPGSTIILPETKLIAGDINDDNKLDIIDYNDIISCFNDLTPSISCLYPITSQSFGANINDNGIMGGADYNLFLRELTNQHGL